ncbi:unnamed protein product [Oncorhynchus mykiss]|uniref:Uncharacterized protein n=1 Tax=Oncorhynchus mykiss TaxID=8022 RepID=A0A060WGC5_ONCMY|nr:unnamed protein product [Oncorhynchus mykiss]
MNEVEKCRKCTFNINWISLSIIYHIPWIYLPVRTALAIWHQLTKSEIPELAKASVLMRDRSRVEETIQAMQRAGPDALQVTTGQKYCIQGQRSLRPSPKKHTAIAPHKSVCVYE